MLAALIMTSLVGCDRGPDKAVGRSDEPRIPDAQGTVTEINDRQVVLDGKDTFPISPQVESFKTHSGHEITPVVHWKNKYVHVGLKDDAVIWIAGIGITIPGEPRTVIYSGVLTKKEGDRLVFKDGTVLKSSGSAETRVGSRVVVTIDADRHLVSSVEKASG